MTLLFIYLAIALGISFLCSILEAVLLSVTPSFVAKLQSENPQKAKHLVRVKERLDDSLASILILNTFAHTMGAAGVGSQALKVFGPEWETLIAVLLTLGILYFSEIIPKTLGARFWQQLAHTAALLIVWLVRLVYPLVWFSTRLTRLFGNKKGHEITREEIIALASLGQKDGTLFSQENEYLANMLRLREVHTEQILTPRMVVHMVKGDLSVSDALDDPKTRQFSRMPVFGENRDMILGKVLRADLYDAERRGEGNKQVKELIRSVSRVSEKVPVRYLLDLFIRQKIHMAMVEDEFGQIRGIVTLEDAIETLLGREIVDERDTVEDMQELAREKFRERLRDNKIIGPE